MTMFAQPLGGSDAAPPDELIALSWLESTPNAVRLRIAGLAPDQLYRGTVDRLSIAEEVALATERDRAYLGAFQRAQVENVPDLVEPLPGPALLDRDFGDDLAEFFDLRRMNLDLLRSLNEKGWGRRINVGGEQVTIRDLAIRLAQLDKRMLRRISEQKRGFIGTSGVDELRDSGVAGKLGENLSS